MITPVAKEEILVKILFSVLLVLTITSCGMDPKSTATLTWGELKPSSTLEKPDGNGPFPAVVLLHGCGGIKEFNYTWAKRLKESGYVTLVLDSLSPRGVFGDTCDGFTVHPAKRALDAHAAKSYLSKLSYVDRSKIAVIGWSHGGWSILYALRDQWTTNPKEPFKAAIAVYPYCGHPNKQFDNLNAPLLILTGKKDSWCPPKHCLERIPSNKTSHDIILKLYPNAYHSFDNTQHYERRVYKGYVLEYNATATKRAINDVNLFLQKHLK